MGDFGTNVTRHSKYVTFQLAEVAVTRNLFAPILNRIARLAMPPPAVCRMAVFQPCSHRGHRDHSAACGRNQTLNRRQQRERRRTKFLGNIRLRLLCFLLFQKASC